MIVGVATFLMGCLPRFAEIGYLAPALLVALRFIQGFALGGEWGGAVLLVAEHSPNKSRGFWSSWPQAAVPVGNLLATLVLFIMSSTLSAGSLPRLGLARGLLALRRDRVRRLLHPHPRPGRPIFLEAQGPGREGKRATASSKSSASTPSGIFSAMGLRFAENIMYYLVVSFAIVYLKSVAQVRHLLAPARSCWSPTSSTSWSIPHGGQAVGHLRTQARVPGRRHPRRNLGVLRLPDVRHPQRRGDPGAMTIGLCFHALMYAGQPAIMAEMFPTRMRYSGVSLG